jgi:hypothetical protein
VPNEVHTWVLDDQAAVPHAAIDRVPIYARLPQLAAGDATTLSAGDLRNLAVDCS